MSPAANPSPTVPRLIHSRAPVRLDLAGGTVDIWPLFLMLDKPLTVNLGIDLWAETDLKIEEKESGKTAGSVTFRALDQKIEQTLSWEELDSAQMPPGLDLHVRLFRYFVRGRKDELRKLRVTFATRAQSPAGAGLGGSSALTVSMIGALLQWLGGGERVEALMDGDRIIDVARDIETQVIKVPAGLQDYYGAAFGGLQRIFWDVYRPRREWMDPAILGPLSKRLLLFYSGQSRNSGINNWALFKDFIDRKDQVREKFASIVSAAAALDTALSEGDWVAAGSAIRREWETRRTLAPGISTPEIDRAFETALSKGATAGKICGAGGGGCFFLYEPTGDMGRLEAISEAVTALGIRRLPFNPAEKGLEVTVHGA